MFNRLLRSTAALSANRRKGLERFELFERLELMFTDVQGCAPFERLLSSSRQKSENRLNDLNG
jgi:hypothetical protein